MEVIGYERNCFRTKDNTEVSGYNLYLTVPVAAEVGKGTAAERIYLSDAKLAATGIDIDKLVGREVQVIYNRNGKVSRICML